MPDCPCTREEPGTGNTPRTAGSRPLSVGDPGYVMFIDRVYANGHITEHELRERLNLSAFVYRQQKQPETVHKPADHPDGPLPPARGAREFVEALPENEPVLVEALPADLDAEVAAVPSEGA